MLAHDRLGGRRRRHQLEREQRRIVGGAVERMRALREVERALRIVGEQPAAALGDERAARASPAR